MAAPSLTTVFRAWLLVGLRSFGGGPATLFLIRRAFVEENEWISADQFTRDWALCQLAPGINLIALTLLLGRRLHGWRGALAGMAGMLLPSALFTVLIAAFYAHVQRAPAVRAALHGVIPATVGVGIATAWGMLRPPMDSCRREGGVSVALAVVLLVGAGVAALRFRTAVFPILLCAGAVGSAYQAVRSRSHRPDLEEEA